MKNRKIISILTPCFNEEENIAVLCQRVRDVMGQIPQYDYEHIFIDNSSTDKTVALIRREIENDKHIRCIVNARNFGQNRSPFHGVRQCYGDAVVPMCADLQDPPEVVLDFVKKWEEGHKVVLGVKNKSKENKIKFLIRKLFYRLMDRMSDVEQVPNFIGFGLYDKEFVDVLRQVDDPNPFFRGLVNELSYNKAFVYYEQPLREFGRTKNNFFSLYSIAMLGFVSYSKVPLRLASFTGMAVALISFLIGLSYLVYKLIFWNSFSAGQAPLVIGLFFLSAVQLIFIGVIGEYIGDIQSQVKKRPLVIEKERINFSGEDVKKESHESTKRCIACGGYGSEGHVLIKLDNLPSSAQNIPAAEDLNQDKGLTLTLWQCPDCGLVQLDTEPVSYYKDVIRAGGGSSTMRDLRLSQYKDFIEKFRLEGKKILEVGCGRGEFLSMLAEFNVDAVGLENSAESVRIAQQKGLTVYQGFADNNRTCLPGGPYDAFVQFNFLEHQPRPADMLRCIYSNLSPDGVGLITVPSWEYMVENDGYYEIIRDHLAYYSLPALENLLEGCGFEVVDHKIVNRDTHAVMVRKRAKENIQRWKDNYLVLKKELDTWVNGILEKGGKVAVWGASHQGFTLIPSMDLSDKISYIIDSAPFKQGRFAPSSHVKIVPPEHFAQEPVEAILIVAPGYTDEIHGIIRAKFGMDIQVAVLRSNHLEKF